jgi:hypothetical protein
MKKIFICILLLLFVFISIGCQKQDIQEGIDNDFYVDMVKCLNLTQKTLETKNRKFIREIESYVEKYTCEGYIEIVFGLKDDSNIKVNNPSLK